MQILIDIMSKLIYNYSTMSILITMLRLILGGFWMAKLECPICGKSFNEEDMCISDNGNLVCFICAGKELKANAAEENVKWKKQFVF